MRNGQKTVSFEEVVNRLYASFLIEARDEDIMLQPEKNAVYITERKGRETGLIEGQKLPRSEQYLAIRPVLEDVIAYMAFNNEITAQDNKISPQDVRNLKHFGGCLAYMQEKIGLKDLESDTLAELFAKSVNHVISQQHAPNTHSR